MISCIVLMICCVYIIVIHDCTYVKNIMRIVSISYGFLCTLMIITEEQNVIITKLRR